MVSRYRISAIKGFLLFFVSISGWLFAAFVPRETAEQAARGWIHLNPAPMEIVLSGNPQQTEEATDAEGRTLYYVVHLEPRGFVVLSANNAVEPVIAFSATGRYDGTKSSPLRTLLDGDMKARLDPLRQPSAEDGKDGIRAAVSSEIPAKWKTLLEAAAKIQIEDGGNYQAAGLPSVSDVRVTPLLQSLWGQDNAADGYCYNYYTPNHYSTGCVATAMAQLIRYHSWPAAGIGVHSFRIYVNGAEQYRNTRGGDGFGGAYNWSQMPYNPEAGLTQTQREAIGALCYDAGLSVNMGYSSTGSGASTSTADLALVNTFGYSNSIYGYVYATHVNAGFTTMMYPNLDAGLPIIVSVSGPDAAHAVVADGYGYIGDAAYHHLNMGWSGLDDAWYQLPTIDSGFLFNVVTGCIYNVYPTGTGEIVSGRVTTVAGAPLEGVTVTAYKRTAAIQMAVTNSRGIYALKYLPSNEEYCISAVKSGHAFSDQMVWTGLSGDWNSASGNKWGVNFTSINPLPPTAFDQTVEVNSQSSLNIGLEALDDHLPNPPGQMTFIITSLPSHGMLSEPNVGPIAFAPYVMASAADSVCYTPCPYFGGEDCFSFKANDGGAAPSGGDSNIATVTLNVDNRIYSEFGTDGTISTNTMINTTYYASRSQALYLKSDIGSARTMTDLAIHFTQKPPITLHKFAIRMQYTNKTEYNDVVADFLTSGWTLVYRADTTISQTGWTTFHFSKPFYYNGTQNLLIEFSFDNTALSGNTGLYLFKDVGEVDRVITIVTPKASHSDPLTWDFWYNDGWYWGGGWLAAIQFSGTIPIEPMAGDFDATCNVKLPDLAVLAAAWKSQAGDADYNSACDLSTPKDNTVDLLDLLVFAEQWLQHYSL